MTLKVYGLPQSSATQRVLVVLKEKNVPYELVPVDFFGGELKSLAFLAKSPFGLIPYIDDDGFILCESLAICKYIAAKYAGSGTPLLPDQSDVKAVALFEEACSVEESNFQPIATGIVVEKYFKAFRGLQPDDKVVEECISKLNEKLGGYEAILKKRRFLTGDNMTVADLAHLPTGTIIGDVGVKLLGDPDKRPNVARWWKEISSLPSWLTVVAEAKAA
ncbi:glutathione S-transferase [Irpex rosettiformis]|uniref:Glutathione S-transferase n=1 Tax=Irpex rosettiformis TaxID=378272 RepID=A0ACB8UDX9_9APHY|nr:glutathione S-transferase [Irpex rosettiformis]